MERHPIKSRDARIQAFRSIVRFMVYFGIAVGIWGTAFGKSFIQFGVVGAVVGLLLSLIFVAQVIVIQKTVEGAEDIIFGSNSMLGFLSIIIGISGLIVWMVRVLFW